MGKTFKEIRKFFIKKGSEVKLPPAGRPQGEYDRKEEKKRLAEEAKKLLEKGS